MNLDCPGCKSRLKLDPARLPPGATTAVCPKCRTRILLPGAAPVSSDISVQCPACSARLKVNVSRLKPGVSQSKCPKCGGAVALPAAPVPPPSQAPPAPDSMPVSAKTRRLDPREIGMMLGAGKQVGGEGPSSQGVPIAVDEVLEHSDFDLGRLIEQKVEGLGKDASGKQAAVPPPQAAAIAVAPGRAESTAPLPPAPPSTDPAKAASGAGASPNRSDRSGAGDLPRKTSDSGSRVSAGEPPRRVSDSGSRASPRVEPQAAHRELARPIGPAPLVASGMAGGAIVSGVLALAGSFFPEFLVPRAPDLLISVLGDKLSLVLITVALAGMAGLLGGKARPPLVSPEEGETAATPGISVFRCAVAAGLMGLLAGVAISLIQGGFDIVVTLQWTLCVAAAGLLAAPILSFLARR